MDDKKAKITEVVEEEKPKKRRGRPKGSSSAKRSSSTANKPDFSEKTGLETTKLFTMLYGKGGSVANRNPIWQMEDSEIAALSAATDAVLAKYTLSDDFAYKEELSLALVMFTTVIPRAFISLKIKRMRYANGKAKQNNVDNRPERERKDVLNEETKPEN